MFQIISHQYTVLGQHPHLLIRSLPTQLIDETVAQYYQHYNDFVNTRAFLEENRYSLDTSSELDKFLLGLTHSAKIFLIAYEERLFNDPNTKRKFTQGAIVNTVTQYLSELHLDNGSVYSFSSRYDDSNSDSDSDSDLHSRPPLSRFSGLKCSARTSSLTRFAPSSSKKKKKKTPTRHVNRIQFDVHDPLASLVILDGLENHQILLVNMYTAGLRKVTKDVTKFTDVMKCIICHQPHSFDQCPILNDIPYIKKHFISYCLQMNNTQKQMLAAIHCIDATWSTDINHDNHNHDNDNDNDDDDNDEDEDSSNVNTENDTDFQEEEE